MNQRERFLATAAFQEVDRTFLLPPWVWNETLDRWVGEGLPKDAKLHEVFQTDEELDVPVRMQGPYGPHLSPPLERKVLSEDETHIVVQDEEGNIVRLMRDDPLQCMPQWLKYPMADRKDWETIVKPRLDPHKPGRLPEVQEWAAFVAQARKRESPLGIWAGSFYGWPRSLMGVENISYTLFDDPDLVHEMCEHIADFVIELFKPILRDVIPDFAYIWEDMAGKGGPLCSPAMYREFMGGPLRRVTDMLHSYGIEHIIIDSDGFNDPLIPVWLDCGVTGLRPFEIAAGSDPVAVRRQYGKNLIIQGGIDKIALAGDFAGIEREVLSKVPWLCLQGGYFPQVDHLTPPDVSLTNYRYYASLMRKVVEDPERYLHEARRKGYWVD
jgi:hypothetical protein